MRDRGGEQKECEIGVVSKRNARSGWRAKGMGDRDSDVKKYKIRKLSTRNLKRFVQSLLNLFAQKHAA